MTDAENNGTGEISDGLLLLPITAVGSYVLMLLGFLLLGLFQLPGPTWLEIVPIVLPVTISHLCSFGSIFVYMTEAEKLEEAGADWVPRWWVYALLTVPFGVPGPAFYLIMRFRRTTVSFR